MKAYLMFRDRDFHLAEELRVADRDMIQDLELDTLWDAMSSDDKVVREVVQGAMLSSLTDPQEIFYRQQVLYDCMQQPAVVREMYDLAVEAIAAEKGVFRSIFANHGEALVSRSVEVLGIFMGMLGRLRQLAVDQAAPFRSEGFLRFFQAVCTELDDDYFATVSAHLKRLRFREGVMISAQLGNGNQGDGYILRTPREENRTTFLKRASVKKPAFSLTIADRDEAGFRALSELRDRGLDLVANAVAQSADHVLSFFRALRVELGFYVGCLNLRDRLDETGAGCFPSPQPAGRALLSARGLYDPCLALRLEAPVVGNDLDADDKPLVVITGANQGGKSTFLRSLGLAHLMMQSGMFVAATSFSSTVTTGIFTHYRREEDSTMSSGKFDEELSRMSQISDAIGSGALLMCNESFAATNEREGSEIAAEVVRAMNHARVRVVFVTHMFELATRLKEEYAATSLFLRAERGDTGRRSFRIAEGEPLSTSFGPDLYRRTFGDDAPAGAAAIRPPAG